MRRIAALFVSFRAAPVTGGIEMFKKQLVDLMITRNLLYISWYGHYVDLYSVASRLSLPVSVLLCHD